MIVKGYFSLGYNWITGALWKVESLYSETLATGHGTGQEKFLPHLSSQRGYSANLLTISRPERKSSQMGYPEGRAPPPGNGNGAYHVGPDSSMRDTTPMANGQSNQVQPPHSGPDSNSAQDRADRYLDPASGESERVRSAKRRPSGQQRICGKCQRTLTGQFVRALGDTFHLECFTCHVRHPFPWPPRSLCY